MNTTTRIHIAAAAALLGIAPLAATAAETDDQAAPVSIAATNATQNFFSIPYGPQRLYLNDVAITFVNHANVAANDVEFAVTRDGKTEIVAEHGSFAPGTQIDRDLARSTDTLPQAAATVAIAKVQFVDGSSWTAKTAIASR